MSSSVILFEYPSNDTASPVLWEVMSEIGAASDRANGSLHPSSLAQDREPPAATSVEDTKQIFAAGREQGMREAQSQLADAQHALLREAETKRVEQAVHLAAQLTSERDQFLQNVEHEVVQLALAIAARILRREAQVDPLFLIGAVRVVLGQLSDTIRVNIRIPADEAELWTQTIAHLPNLKSIPSVIPDNRMQLGECIIETEMGSVDLGLTTQLGEAERTLFRAFGGKAPDRKTSSVHNLGEEHS